MYVDQRMFRNSLLNRLGGDSTARLSAHLEPVDLPLRLVLSEPSQTVPYIHFPECGLASVIVRSATGTAIEIGHVGCDGMTASHVALGVDASPAETFMQIKGHGFRVEAAAFRRLLVEDDALRALVLAYVHAGAVQLAYSALANARFNIHARLSRWLLMCHDRVAGNDLPLTHEFLSHMLGVRRSGVTDELHILEGEGLIRGTRGNIRVLERGRLEAAAAGIYGPAEAEYARVLGVPPCAPAC